VAGRFIVAEHERHDNGDIAERGPQRQPAGVAPQVPPAAEMALQRILQGWFPKAGSRNPGPPDSIGLSQNRNDSVLKSVLDI
jgi:hypothetical protein